MTRDELPLSIVVPSFVLSELRTAFQMGFLIFIPFIIVDFIVASSLMSMGMMMMPPVVISMPFKLLLFVLVDGWYLIVQSLVRVLTFPEFCLPDDSRTGCGHYEKPVANRITIGHPDTWNCNSCWASS